MTRFICVFLSVAAIVTFAYIGWAMYNACGLAIGVVIALITLRPDRPGGKWLWQIK